MATHYEHGPLLSGTSYSSTAEIVSTDTIKPGHGHQTITFYVYSTQAGTLTAYRVDSWGRSHAVDTFAVSASTELVAVCAFPLWPEAKASFTPTAATAGEVWIEAATA